MPKLQQQERQTVVMEVVEWERPHRVIQIEAEAVGERFAVGHPTVYSGKDNDWAEDQSDIWTVYHLASVLTLGIKMTRRQDTVAIAELLDRECGEAFDRIEVDDQTPPRPTNVHAVLPKWVRPWLRQCDLLKRCVDHLPFAEQHKPPEPTRTRRVDL